MRLSPRQPRQFILRTRPRIDNAFFCNRPERFLASRKALRRVLPFDHCEPLKLHPKTFAPRRSPFRCCGSASSSSTTATLTVVAKNRRSRKTFVKTGLFCTGRRQNRGQVWRFPCCVPRPAVG